MEYKMKQITRKFSRLNHNNGFTIYFTNKYNAYRFFSYNKWDGKTFHPDYTIILFNLIKINVGKWVFGLIIGDRRLK